MTEDAYEEVRLLQRELAFCAGERDVYRALLEQVLKAYDRGTDAEDLYRATQAVRDALTTPREDPEIALRMARVRKP
jgi:hypothetical protein